MNSQLIGFAILMFFLSMICERIADFLKNFFSQSNGGTGYAIGKWLHLDTLLNKYPADSTKENKRYYRILKINIYCGFVTAWAMHADFFSIIRNLNNNSFFNNIGWKNIIWIWDSQMWKSVCENPGQAIQDGFLFILGCFATGFFISFGSKTWHDLLDLLYQTKNYKRILSDPDTYAIDNTQAFDERVKSYDSEIIQAAYLKIKSKLSAEKNVVETGIKYDEDGYYISVKLTADNPAITDEYDYQLDNGEIKTVRIKKIITGENIIAHAINLSDQVFNIKAAADFGTVGCIVKKGGNNFVLTCYHNVVEPGSNFKFDSTAANQIQFKSATQTYNAKVTDAVRDYEIDAAIISIPNQEPLIVSGKIPGIGFITGKRENITKNDIKNNIRVFMHGAADTNGGIDIIRKGSIDGVHCDVSISYGSTKHQLQNLIAISNSGKAISLGGDSGAPILDFDNNILGILVAGDSTTSYAMPIESILNKMSLELILNK